MGLATIDPHNQEEHTEIHKIPNFGVNQASFDWDTAIQKRQNLKKKCMAIRTLSVPGDPGATSRDDAIFSGERHFWRESLFQGVKSPFLGIFFWPISGTDFDTSGTRFSGWPYISL